MAYQSEIEKLQRRYDEKPEQWFAALADAHRKAGEIGEALIIVRSGIEERPNYVSGHIVLGRCLVDEGSDDEAERVFEGVLDLDAENIIALKSLGEIAERQGEPASAQRWLHRLLEVDPMNDDARSSLERLGQQAAGEPAASEPAQEQPAVVEPEPVVAESLPLEEPGSIVTPTVEETVIGDGPTTQMEPPDVSVLEGIEPTALSGESPVPPAPYADDEPFVVQASTGPFAEPEPDEVPGPSPDDVLPLGDGTPEINELDLSGRGTWIDSTAEANLTDEIMTPSGSAGSVEADTAEMEEIKGPWGGEPAAPPEKSAAEAGVSGTPPAGDDDEITERIPAVTAEAIREFRGGGSGAASGEDTLDMDAVPDAPAAPELVVTETMAEVYAEQGLLEQARSVYEELVAANPSNGALRERLGELDRQIAERTPAAAPETAGYAARETGGVSVRAFLTGLLAERPTGSGAPAGREPRRISLPAGPSPMDEAFGGGPSSGPEGEPARPAGDDLSLASVFGEDDAAPADAGAPGAQDGGDADATAGEGLSFDQFFGSTQAPKAAPPPEDEGEDTGGGDDESFKAWLRGLKT